VTGWKVPIADGQLPRKQWSESAPDSLIEGNFKTMQKKKTKAENYGKCRKTNC